MVISIAFDMYMNEVNGIQPLTSEEEARLVIQVQNGDKKARDQLVKANLKFVITMARKYLVSNVLLEDLVNAGNIGLLTAASKFDPARNCRFITYARWWIQYELQNASRGGSVVYYPIHKYDQMKKDSFTYCSLDAPFNEDDESSLLCLLADDSECVEDVVIASAAVEDVRKAIRKLSPKEQGVITYRYGLFDAEQKSLSEIAGLFGMSREGIRKIERRAKEKLKYDLSVYSDIPMSA